MDTPARLGRAWRRYRMWRRTRPFWGGLLLLLAGVELLAIPLLSVVAHGSIKVVIYIGIGGVFGLLIGGLLAACGLLVWLHPSQRVFYSIAGVLLAVLSFVATNLGGFFIGMLLGVTGASLSFAWMPGNGSGRARPRRRRRRAPEGTQGTGITHSQDVTRSPGRTYAFAVVSLALLWLIVPARTATSTQRSSSSSKCILLILCPSPSPKPTAPPGPEPGPAPVPSAGAPPPGGIPTPGITSPDPGATSKPGRKAPKGKDGKKDKRGRKASSVKASAAGLQVPKARFDLETATAQIRGFAYHGVAHVPTAGGGTVAMMKFTMDSLMLTGTPTMTITQNGLTSATTASSMTFSGHVVLYATRLSGDLLGVPVTITPSSPLSLILKLANPVTPSVPLKLTNVTTDQPYISTHLFQAPGFDLKAS